MSTEKTPAIQALEKQRRQLHDANEVHERDRARHQACVDDRVKWLAGNNASIDDISRAIEALEYPNGQD